jgi:hypothetical protein
MHLALKVAGSVYMTCQYLKHCWIWLLAEGRGKFPVACSGGLNVALGCAVP